MFKNTLFLKIILIFTLPALGILYFSSILVYEKVELVKEVDDTYKNLTYLKSVESVVSNLQKERDLAIKYYLLKVETPAFDEQQLKTNETFEAFKKVLVSLDLYTNFNQYKLDINKLELFRNKIENLSISLDEIFFTYNEFDQILLNSLKLMKPVKLAIDFNTDLSNISHFLNFKEASSIENTLVKIYLVEKSLDNKLYDIFLKNYSIQDINKNYFFNNSSLDLIQKFSGKSNEDYTTKIFLLRKDIKDRVLNKSNLKFEEWETISNSNIEYLSEIYNNLISSMEESAVKYEEEILVDRNKSLIFLFVCFSTLISLLFVLRNIIFNEQKSFYKVQKHKEIYELLNQANKFLLKTFNKERLYENICELLSENENLEFCFIYDVNDKKIIAKDGVLKDKIITQIDKYDDKTQDNIVSKTIKWETNIIINNFKEKNISVFYNDAEKLHINSMATFPIKKFNEIVGTLILYSNELNFFDQEVEILFDKLVNDVTHCLEKIEYEEIRLKQEDELRLSSYAFES
ncbi:MAG: nitrate- and nitrite sensing domain-containing protein, partial [Arcobacter sp.]